ncbi:hypothetical protein Egran_00176, partial [Elaphomyces granulatus]
MMRPKRVAIIGAGPSGIVTAKTLLHNYPKGTFEPIIFEKKCVIGGLWPIRGDDPENHNDTSTTRKAGFISPQMRTNLSRFTVSFSDLSWESVIGDDVPMFPRASQVGEYLETYMQYYIPPEVLKLGCKVVGTERRTVDGEGGRWRVEWEEGVEEQEAFGDITKESNMDVKRISGSFDYLVVASGYFSKPYIPHILGLEEFQDRVIHSSALQNIRSDLLPRLKNYHKPGSSGGKLVVIGGSLSATEAASSLALHLSSAAHTPGLSDQCWKGYTVQHICSRPFWSLPMHLPNIASNETSKAQPPSFLPLDLAMYDLSRRPPGLVNYSLGPVPSQRCIFVNNYFQSLLGTDQGDLGDGSLLVSEELKKKVPWIAVSDSYAEFVRSGGIKITNGRVTAIHNSPSTELGMVEVVDNNGDRVIVEDIAAVVFATGFTPFDSLSFLPKNVLGLLEFSEDTFFPIILDRKGSMNTRIPDLGFVGMYRGPYWGVMEMQARSLGQIWTQASAGGSHLATQSPSEDGEAERQLFRDLRCANREISRPQFPMGDYVGLMESFARDLFIHRYDHPGKDERSGPVAPARYQLLPLESHIRVRSEAETVATLSSMQAVLSGSSEDSVNRGMTAKAIFRALQGHWKFSRVLKESSDSELGNNESSVSGAAFFHPRYPTDPHYESEYLYEENETQPAGHKSRSIYRLCNVVQHGQAHIGVWTVAMTEGLNCNMTDGFSHGLARFNSIPGNNTGEQTMMKFQAIAKGKGCGFLSTGRYYQVPNGECVFEYTFYLRG